MLNNIRSCLWFIFSRTFTILCWKFHFAEHSDELNSSAYHVKRKKIYKKKDRKKRNVQNEYADKYILFLIWILLLGWLFYWERQYHSIRMNKKIIRMFESSLNSLWNYRQFIYLFFSTISKTEERLKLLTPCVTFVFGLKRAESNERYINVNGNDTQNE